MTDLVGVRLLELASRATGEVMAAVPENRLDAPSPCKEWTVRAVANHLVSGMEVFARVVEGEVIDFADLDADAREPDYLGADPGRAFRATAARWLAAFRRPGVFEQEFPFVFGPAPGQEIASISLQEMLIHGWDIARGSGLPYTPDDAVVDAVSRFNASRDVEILRRQRMFGPAQSPPPDASPLSKLLALLGRRV